jgi:hypothetical protein
MLDKYERIGKLFDFYSNILKDKHKDVLDLYYFQDLSLAEISEIFDMSRQGVHDLLKRAEGNLENFEKKLGLIDRNDNIREKLELLKNNMNGNDFDQKDIVQIIDGLIDSL